MVIAFGTLDIAAVNEAAVGLVVGSGTLVWIGLLLLVAATGKSAQLPLQVWLPDAMAGPTPVSALIHAATMVTAGVYLVARSAPLFVVAPEVSVVIAWVGALTALVAAFAAFAQTDIKKILAYSTISQLGFMFVAVGAGAYWVGIFHLFTHAFFKALLFLGAGSVIHALDGEQDIRKMGGLGRRMRVTGTTSLIATLAIAGVPLLSGFFSKDAILAHTFNSNLLAGNGAVVIYAILLLSAAMTAFYMFRWYHGIFAGQERINEELKTRVHESPQVMTVPLVVLSIFSIGAGYVGLPAFAFPNAFSSWIEPVTKTALGFAHPALAIEWALLLLSVTAAAVGLGVAYWVYEIKKGGPVGWLRDKTINRLSHTGLGFDSLYRTLFVRPAESIAEGLRIIDRDLIDHGISSTIGSFGLLARVVRRLQSGFVRSYAFVMLLCVSGLVLLVALFGGKL
jgi:NADH-quinone oxidoreductase subunit L